MSTYQGQHPSGLDALFERINRLKDTGDLLGFTKDEINSTIPKRFTRVAARFQQQVAVQEDHRSLTYQGLEQVSNRIANSLLSRIGKGSEPIALLLEHGIPLISAILGVLKSGKYYITLNPNDPLERLVSILNDVNAEIVMTDDSNMRIANGLTGGSRRVFSLDQINLDIFDQQVNLEIDPDELMGVFFTSGSTGEPKGIPVTHRNALHRIWVETNSMAPSILDRFTQLTIYGFTSSITDIFNALLNGASLYPKKITGKEGETLARWINREKITVLRIPVALLRAFIATLQPGDYFPSLRMVSFGGETVYTKDVKTLFEYIPASCVLMHRLSASEVGQMAAFFLDRDTLIETEILPVGYAVPDKEILIVDEQFKRVAIGEVGEIVIRSDYLFPGYWRRPDLTKDKLVVDPDFPGRKILLTGDFGRMQPDGCLELVGRKDFMIKVRGFRVELEAIERALHSLESVKQAAVVASSDIGREKRLVAYIVLDSQKQRPVSYLRRALETKLPDYMIPSTFVILNALPLTATGKINRLALPHPGRVRPELDTEYVPVRTEIETALEQIWKDLLKLELVGIKDSFIELGGDSLSAALVLARIYQSYQVEISMRRFLEAPTIERLAQAILEQLEAARKPQLNSDQETEYRNSEILIPQAEGSNQYPLSFAQERMWFINQLDPGVATYNEPKVLHIRGLLNLDALRKAFQAVVERHEILRTVYTVRLGSPVQVVLNPQSFELPVVNLQAKPDSQRAFDRLVQAEIQRPFNLNRDLMIRAVLFEMGELEYILVLVTHHIASDRWSTGNMFRELSCAYKAFSEGVPPALPELPLQYKDFAAWQRSRIAGKRIEDQMNYWKQKLKDIPVLELAVARPHSTTMSTQGTLQSYTIPSHMRETVKAFSRAEGKTLFMTLFATLLVLFYRYSGQTDICVGTVVMNRNRQELESMLGFLINTLALRVSLTGKPTFRELLERVKIVVLEALEYQELPFEMLVKELNPERSLARHPLFQISFNLDDGISPELELLGTEVERLEFHTGTTKFDLSLTIVDRTPEMKLRIEYNNGLFSPQMIDRMAGQFRNLLEGMIANPDNPISLLPLLTHVEQVQILKEGDLGRADLNEIESKYDGQQSSNYEAKPKQLPSPDAGERFLTPRTSVEQVLARIWKEILNSGRLGAQDNFFDLGGNSLLALRLVSKLQDVLQINLPVRMVFEWPTLGELTQVVLSISEDAERTENMAQIVLWVADLSDEQAIKLLTGKKPD